MNGELTLYQTSLDWLFLFKTQQNFKYYNALALLSFHNVFFIAIDKDVHISRKMFWIQLGLTRTVCNRFQRLWTMECEKLRFGLKASSTLEFFICGTQVFKRREPQPYPFPPKLSQKVLWLPRKFYCYYFGSMFIQILWSLVRITSNANGATCSCKL